MPGTPPKPSKYLFVDDRWIEETCGISRAVGTPLRDPANPVLEPLLPWESGGVICYGSVIQDGDRLRMWYQVYGTADRPWRAGAVGHAVSRDGVTWEKPLNGLRIDGVGPTNLVMLGGDRSHLFSPAVVIDDGGDPAERYKMVFFGAMSPADFERLGSPFPPTTAVPGWHPVDGEGLFAAVSDDGLAWRLVDPRPVAGGPCDASAMSRGEDGVYRTFVKTSRREDRHFRIIGLSQSTDFRIWSEPQVVLEPDWRDPPGTEFYGMSGFDYFGNRLGLVWVYRNAPDDKRVEIELAAEDQGGSTWSRVAERRVLLGAGESGSWDAGVVYAGSEPLVSPAIAPDEIWIYYGGINVRHDDLRYRRSAIGLARLRLDGFASLDAGHWPGDLLTRPLDGVESDLYLNLNGAHGWAEIECLATETGEVLAVSERIERRDGTAIPVIWKSGSGLPAQRPVRLRLKMCQSRLYAFWFGGAAR